MPRKNKTTADAEAFVRSVLSFKQKVDPDTVRAIAEKVSQVVAESAPRKSQAYPRREQLNHDRRINAHNF
jgi:predicted secreted Zn-dependent protease